MTIVVGLTGSIGMGKSTTAKMFRDLGIPVWDADAAVHRLYEKGGAAVGPLGALYPGAIVDGVVSRDALKAWIANDTSAIAQIEAVVHPLVAADRQQFLNETGVDIAVLDVPLLFETGLHADVDRIVCVTAPPEVQRSRVLARPGMTQAQFEKLLAKQMPDADKRARSDYIIETKTLDAARAQVSDIVEDLKKAAKDA